MKNYTELLNSVQNNIIENSTAMDEYREEYYRMSLGSLKSIANHAAMLVAALESNQELQKNLTQSWMQGKIAITEDYLLTIFNNVMFSEAEDSDDEYSMKELGSLWENIRKKKERMGKKYKPAKPGDKDRPDPDAWKKAQK